MATLINLHISDELLAELQTKAATEGRTVEDVASDALRTGLEERAWRDLLAYGRERGEASGRSEFEIPAIVKEWRREHRDR